MPGLESRKALVACLLPLAIFVTARLLSQTGHLPAEEEAAIRRRFFPEGEADPGADALPVEEPAPMQEPGDG